MEARDVREMTYEAYLALERTAGGKHEYVNGRVYAMAGGSPEHARLAQSIGAELRTALRGQPCAPFSSDLRVRVAATGRATYPDVTIVCGRLERASDDDDAVTNPRVIVEVLSDTTESEDRGDTWAHYQRIPSLREYVLVSQRSRRIEVFARDEAQPELWHYRDLGAGASVALPSLGVSVDVDAVYASPLEP
jgi:Uma2 family endonuclease